MLSVSVIILFDFRIVPTMCYFLFFISLYISCHFLFFLWLLDDIFTFPGFTSRSRFVLIQAVVLIFMLYVCCNMHSFPWFLFMVYIPECKQQLWRDRGKNTQRYEILHTLNMGSSFVTLRQPCNNLGPRCDIAWLHVTNHLYHDFPG